jgi:hypothetical protein
MRGSLSKDRTGDKVIIALALVGTVGPRIVAPNQHQASYLRCQAFPQGFYYWNVEKEEEWMRSSRVMDGI